MGWKDTIQPISEDKSMLESISATGQEYLEAGKNYLQDIAPDAEDVGRGVVQGGTLGFSDELIGAAGATGEKLKSLLSSEEGRSWLEAYREKQKAEEAANLASKERSPWLYGAGELAGGVATGLATAGIGAGAGAAKTVGQAALTGAELGAIQAAGTSKGSLEDIEEAKKLGKDVVGGAAMGGVLGPVAHGIGKALTPKTGIDDSRYLRQLVKSYEKGKEGVKFTGEEATEKLLKQETGTVKDLTNRIFKADKELGQQVGKTVHEASQKGIKIKAPDEITGDLETFLNLSKDNPILLGPGSKSQKITQALEEFRSGTLDPRRAWELTDELTDLANRTDNSSVKAVLKEFRNRMDDQLGDIPGYKDAAEKFYSFRRSVPENLLSKTTPSEFPTKYLSDLKHPQEKVFKSLENLITKVYKPGHSGETELKSFVQLKDDLMNFAKQNPDVMKKLNIDPSEFIGKIRDQADLSAIRQVIQGYEPHSSWWKNIAEGPTGRGLSYRAAAATGRSVSKIKDLGQKLYNATPDELGQVVSTLREVPGLSHYANALEKGLRNKDVAAKNAALFTIMQNPQARLLISGEEPKE